MIQSIVHDPSLFAYSDASHPCFQAFVDQHFRKLREYGVLPLPNDSSAIRESVRQFIQMTPPEKRQLISSLISDVFEKRKKIVSIPEETARHCFAKFQDNDVLARCLALGEVSHPDFTLLTEENFERWESASKIDLGDDANGKLVPKKFFDFPSVECPSEFDLCSLGADGFQKTILEPVFRWADDVWLIDRYLSKNFLEFRSNSSANHNPSGNRNKCNKNPGKNWPRFKKTIHAILDTWQRVPRCFERRGKVHVVTEDPYLREEDSLWGDAIDFARDLQQSCSDNNPALVVHLVNYKWDFEKAIKNHLPDGHQDWHSRIGHARYLLTNFCTLVLDPGFDILEPDGDKITEGCWCRRSTSAGRENAQKMRAIAQQSGVICWPSLSVKPQAFQTREKMATDMAKKFDSMFSQY